MYINTPPPWLATNKHKLFSSLKSYFPQHWVTLWGVLATNDGTSAHCRWFMAENAEMWIYLLFVLEAFRRSASSSWELNKSNAAIKSWARHLLIKRSDLVSMSHVPSKLKGLPGLTTSFSLFKAVSHVHRPRRWKQQTSVSRGYCERNSPEHEY